MGMMVKERTRVNKGRITVLIVAVLLVIGALALAVWRPTADDLSGVPLVASALGSNRGEPVVEVAGGDSAKGPAAMRRYGCISCHTVPGVPGAVGNVGPPLTNWANRSYIAGMLPNSPDNLIYWIQNPQAVVPGNAMPDLGVNDSDARDIAAYLYSLNDGK